MTRFVNVICITARQQGNISQKSKRGRGKKRSLSPTIKVGLFAAMDQETQTEVTSKASKSTVSICKKCLLQIGQGVNHHCTAGNAVNNILDTLEVLPDKVAEQVASAIIKKKAEGVAGKTQNVQLELTTKGSKSRIVLNPEKKPEINISHESIHDLQVGIGNPSNTSMKLVSNWLRVQLGRKSIPVDFDKSLTEKSNTLADEFHVKELLFDGPGQAGKVTRPVIYADCQSLIDKVITEREYVGNPKIIVMADGGGQFFKVCATVLPEHYDWETGRQTEPEADDCLGKRSRSTYAQGGSLRKGKLSGVKRVILLAVVPEIKETHANVSLIFDLIGLNKISFKIVSDFKLQLLVLGLQTASATHPCGYCLISKEQLKDRNIEAAKDRTFGSLEENHKKFLENGGDAKEAKFFYNCVNPCLLEEEKEVRVYEKFILPELHLILGFVSYVMNSLEKLVGLERANLWPAKQNLVPKGYHGGSLEGDACRKLLKLGDKLLDPEILGPVSAIQMQPIVHAVKCMDKVVSAAFSTRKVTEDISCLVDNLGKAVLATDMSITLKMHVLLCHLVPTLKLNYFSQRGMGVCTEQSGESIHSYFHSSFWKSLERSSMNHPQYTENLKKAVVECASKAI